MKIITFDMIQQLGIDSLQCYEWAKEAIERKSEAILPAKISLKPGEEGVFYNTMPVIIPYLNASGVKLVTRYPKRLPSLESEMMLYDLTNGEMLALMDATWITTMRTGAVAAHSAKLFAVDDFKEIGVIGLGNTARAAMKVFLELYPGRTMKIKLKKYKNQHELFAECFKQYPNVTFEYIETYEDVVRNSDIIFSAATVFENDICSDECFKEGVTLIPIHTRGFTNCDLFFDKIYADDVNHVKGFKYFSKYNQFAEVADVVNHEKPGRENDKERILVYNIGIALHDVFYAKHIYELVKDSCEDINMQIPQEKFWV